MEQEITIEKLYRFLERMLYNSIHFHQFTDPFPNVDYNTIERQKFIAVLKNLLITK